MDWKDERVTASLKSNPDTWLSPGQQNKCISRSEALQPFSPAEHYSKFLLSKEVRPESRAGKEQKHQLAQLHSGGGFQKLPFPNRKAEAGAQIWRAESEESFLTLRREWEAKNPTVAQRSALGVLGVLESALRPQKQPAGLAAFSQPTKPIPDTFQLLPKPASQPTSGAGSPAAPGKALWAGAAPRASFVSHLLVTSAQGRASSTFLVAQKIHFMHSAPRVLAQAGPEYSF